MGLIDTVLHCLFRPTPEPLGEVRNPTGKSLVARGRVVARDLIESPLTTKRCVYYRYLVEEWRRSTMTMAAIAGGTDGLWHYNDSDEAIAEFYLDDGTGRALIQPMGAQVETAGALDAQPVEMPSGLRARELRIEPGDWVEVHGVVEEVDDVFDGDRGYREAPTRLALRAEEGGRIRIRLVGRASES